MEKATHLLINGTILTMDSRASSVEAIALQGHRILAVGSALELANLKDRNTIITDLQGQTVLPGFVDGHSHFLRAGEAFAFKLNLTSPPVGTIRNINDILEKIKAEAATKPLGQWITGYGYDDTLLAERRHPLAQDLDKAAPLHPVMLDHISGHLAAVNSLALKKAGLSVVTNDPPGGVFRRQEDGSPNGVLEEPAAMDLVGKLIPSLSPKQWLKAAETASKAYAAKGVTSAQEGWAEQEIFEALLAAWAAHNPLTVRVQILPAAASMNLESLPTNKSGTLLTPDGQLSLGAVKLFADGSLQGYTGYLTNPYHQMLYDLPGGAFNRGYPQISEADLTKTVVKLHLKGHQLAIHGNGDAAIDMILNAYETAQKHYPRAEARHIVIHCQTAREDQLDRIKRLGVIPSFFVTHTYFWGDRHQKYFLGPERAQRLNPLKSALNRNLVFSTHNDTMVTPIDPLMSVWSAVNRLTSGGHLLGANQRIPVLEALRTVTSWSAYQAYEENRKGSLEPGKFSDLVVLKANPLQIDPKEIKDIEIAATMVGGQLIYGNL